MSTLVLTGGLGFIGMNLVERFLLTGRFDGNPQHAAPTSKFDFKAPERLQLIITDLPEALARSHAHRFLGSLRVRFVAHEDLFQVMDELPQAPIAVVHNGACSSTVERDPEVFERLNFGYSKRLWAQCARQGIPFIYASSASVYGDGTHGFADDAETFLRCTPLNLYAKSKHDFDAWALEQRARPPIWFGLRYFNVYGPFEGHKKGQASMVFHGYRQMLTHGKIKLFKSNDPARFADGAQRRDFVFVQDICRVTEDLVEACSHRDSRARLLAQVAPHGGAFLNIGTGVAATWNELAAAVCESLSLPPKIEYIPMPDEIAAQYQNYTCAELATLRRLGFGRAFTPLREGVVRYVCNFLTRNL